MCSPPQYWNPAEPGEGAGGQRAFRRRFSFFSKVLQGKNFSSERKRFGAAMPPHPHVLSRKVVRGGRGGRPHLPSQKKIGGKGVEARERHGGGEERNIAPGNWIVSPPPPTPPCSTPLHPPILGQKVMRGSWRGRPHLPSQKILGGKARRRGRGTAGGAQGRKKGTQGRVSEIFKCNKTC